MSDSDIFNNKSQVRISVPIINAALSGHLEGGLSAGSTIIAGPSKHFKTKFGLLFIADYLAAYKDAICLFYDSEFGSPPAYFAASGIDPARLLHTPVTNLEEFKFDLVSQLDQINRGDHVIIFVDSIGSLPSKKEVEDAKNEKAVADMTRAKAIKSIFRMITPVLSLKDIPLIAINHTYMTQEMFSKPVVSGGTGIYYSADNIWIVGRQQRKEGTELKGFNFIINVDKSRYVKEKSKIAIISTWEKGIDQFSGLLELALAGGFVTKPKMGWYQKQNPDDKKTALPGKYRESETYTEEFWSTYLNNDTFKEFVKAHYTVGYRSLIEGEFLGDAVVVAAAPEDVEDESD